MKKGKIVVLIISIILLLSGVAYARWTEQINIVVKTKTAVTELSCVSNSYKSDSGSVSVAMSGLSQATVSVRNLKSGSKSTITVSFKNTGTIPIDIDNIKILSVGGYSSENKDSLHLTVTGYAGEKRFVQKSVKLFHWKSNSSTTSRRELYQLPVNGTINVICRIKFDEVKIATEEDVDTEEMLSDEVAFENVIFVVRPIFSRFNQD